MSPLDPFTLRRILAFFERNPDALPLAACLIAAAVISRIAELWT